MSRVPLPPAAEREDTRRTRAWLLVTSLLVCFALLGGLWAWTLWQEHHPGPGPLGQSGQGGRNTTTSIALGGSGVGTFALITLANPTGTPAVIEEVRLVPPQHGEEVQLVRSWIARPAGGQAWAAFSGPPGQHYPDLVPAAGTVIPPGDRGGYVLGLTLQPPASSSQTVSSMAGVDVRYRVGGQPYLDRWNDRVVLCPGTSC